MSSKLQIITRFGVAVCQRFANVNWKFANRPAFKACTNWLKMSQNNENKDQRKHYSFPTPVLLNDYSNRSLNYKFLSEASKKFNWNWGIVFVGVSNFMSYAAYFCLNEARKNASEIISVGSGDGTVEAEIMETYREHFGANLDITQVDRDPNFKAPFKTVDELVAKRPNVVGNCVLLIIWPDPQEKSDNYDIDAICKLQPCAVLALYESSNAVPVEIKSGSDDFRALLGVNHSHSHEVKNKFGLENYAVEEVTCQEVHVRAGEILGAADGLNREWRAEPGTCAGIFRLMKLKRID